MSQAASSSTVHRCIYFTLFRLLVPASGSRKVTGLGVKPTQSFINSQMSTTNPPLFWSVWYQWGYFRNGSRADAGKATQDAQTMFSSLARVSCEQMRWAARVCLDPCWVGGRVRDAYIAFEAVRLSFCVGFSGWGEFMCKCGEPVSPLNQLCVTAWQKRLCEEAGSKSLKGRSQSHSRFLFQVFFSPQTISSSWASCSMFQTFKYAQFEMQSDL